MAFYLKFEKDGKDLYPLLREKMNDPKIYNEELVRNEMFKAFDYYVTESSGHNSEYNQWFRKRPDLIEKYCTNGTGWNPGLHAYSLNLRLEREEKWREQLEEWLNGEIDIKRGLEYAAPIFNARFGDHTPFNFNGNLLNNGLITNLPKDACVEVPCLVDRGGLHPMAVGELPPQLAIMVNNTALIENMVVEACMEKNKRKVKWAVCHDPLTSSVCSLEEINLMCEELFEINKAFLGDYK
jgi:alpha-galactosidase